MVALRAAKVAGIASDIPPVEVNGPDAHPLYRWLSLLLMTVGGDGNEMQSELVRSALLRGRMSLVNTA